MRPEWMRATLEVEADILAQELTLLCRGLSHSWSADLRVVETNVTWVDDDDHRETLCAICLACATAAGLTVTVMRAGSEWWVRFARQPVAA